MVNTLPNAFVSIRDEYPEVANTYDALANAARQAGPLSERECQLVKLALAIGANLEGAAHSHARRALEQGVDPAALQHVALLAITTLGFPAAVRGMAWIKDVAKPE